MKKLKLLSVAFIVTAALTGVAFAEDVSTTANVSITAKIDALKAERDLMLKNALLEKQNMELARASSTENLKNKRAEIKSDIEIRIGKRLDEQRTKIAQRFEDVMKSLNNLVARIESRLTKMEAAGTDVTSIRTSFDSAEINITSAGTELTNLENLLAQPIATSTRKATLAAIKTEATKAKNAVELAHKSLINVINSLKPRQEVRATSTTEVKTEKNNASVESSTTIQQ